MLVRYDVHMILILASSGDVGGTCTADVVDVSTKYFTHS